MKVHSFSQLNPIAQQPWMRKVVDCFGERLTCSLIDATSPELVEDLVAKYGDDLNLVPIRQLQAVVNMHYGQVVEDWIVCAIHELEIEDELDWQTYPKIATLARGIFEQNIDAASEFLNEIYDPDVDDQTEAQAYYLESVKAFFQEFDENKISGQTGTNVELVLKQGEYCGNAIDGVAYGTGHLESDKGSYVGDFVDNICHGSGVFSHLNGIVDQGSFYRGFFTGKGTRTLSDGSKIQGSFIKGKIEHGRIFYPNGLSYEGHIRKNKAYGLGTLYDLDGTIKKGSFDGTNILHLTEIRYPQGVVVKVDHASGTWNADYPQGLKIKFTGSTYHLIIDDKIFICEQPDKQHLRFTIPSEVLLEMIQVDVLKYLNDFKFVLGDDPYKHFLSEIYKQALAHQDIDRIYYFLNHIYYPADLSLEQVPSKDLGVQLLSKALSGPINWALASALIYLDPSYLDHVEEGDKLALLLDKNLQPGSQFDFVSDVLNIPTDLLDLPGKMRVIDLIDQQTFENVNVVLTNLKKSENLKVFGMLKEILEFYDQPETARDCVNLIIDLAACKNYCRTRAESEVEVFYYHIFKNAASGGSEEKLSHALKDFLDLEVAQLARRLMEQSSERMIGNEIHLQFAIRNLLAASFPHFISYAAHDSLEETLSEEEVQRLQQHFSIVLTPLSFLFFLESNLPDGKTKALIPQASLDHLLEKLDPNASIADYYNMDDLYCPKLYRNSLRLILENESYIVD